MATQGKPVASAMSDELQRRWPLFSQQARLLERVMIPLRGCAHILRAALVAQGVKHRPQRRGGLRGQIAVEPSRPSQRHA